LDGEGRVPRAWAAKSKNVKICIAWADRVFIFGNATCFRGSGLNAREFSCANLGIKGDLLYDLFSGGVMSLRNALALFLVLSALALLAGCGNGGGITNPIAPPGGGFSKSDLNGTYVFSVSGTDDISGAAIAVVGTLNANGSGGITGGTMDINDFNFSAPIPNLSISSSSSYNVGVDGRGTATLDVTTPFGRKLTFDFVMTSVSHGFIIQFDGNATGSGTLDLQAAGLTQASLAGTYAFSFSGADSAGTGAFATVGNFALDPNGTITSGLADFNDNGLVVFAGQTLAGQVILGPSSSPATLLTTAPYSKTFDVFAIDATHLKFVEMDTLSILSGDAFSQTSTVVPTGNLAFTLAGFLAGAPFASGGFVVTDGAGNITAASTEDFNSNGTPGSSPSFFGSYSAGGTGRYTLGSFSNFVGGSLFAAYPSSGGLLLLEIDTTSLGILNGAAHAQTQGAAFATSEGYGLNLTGINLAGPTGVVEVDDIAEFTANSSGTTVIGLIDENFAPGGVPIFDQKLNGTYTGPDSSGRFGISATAGNSSNSTLNGGFGLTVYTVDGTMFPFIETDTGGQVATGVFVLQTPSASPGVAQAGSHMFVAPPLIRPRAASLKKK
jgi:hypothetical protein